MSDATRSPWKNDLLYAVTIDSWDPTEPANEERPELPPEQLTYRDAVALQQSDIPMRSVVMFKHRSACSTRTCRPRSRSAAILRATTGDFFPMFDMPFLYGSRLGRRADTDADPVVVLSKEIERQGVRRREQRRTHASVGDTSSRVMGVLDDWVPDARSTTTSTTARSTSPRMPTSASAMRSIARVRPVGNTNCWKNQAIESFQDFLNSECVWVQMWVELPTRDGRERYQAFLDNYVREQKALGRCERPLNNRSATSTSGSTSTEVVKKDNRVLIGIALLFLAVCLVNIVGLLLSKFLNGAAMTGLRRALGASRARHRPPAPHRSAARRRWRAGCSGSLLAALGLAGIRADVRRGLRADTSC